MLHVAKLSDVGRARDHQEDAIGVFVPSDPVLLARRGQLLIVADGMGGHNTGEVASATAVAEVQRVYFAAGPAEREGVEGATLTGATLTGATPAGGTPSGGTPAGGTPAGGTPAGATPGGGTPISDDIPTNLRRALLTAHHAIRRLSEADASRQGMGTTAAVVVVRDREVHIANIGDSRVYLLRSGAITQITQDHSWVGEQVRAGVLTLEQARNHPQRNIITRALGSGAAVEPDLFNGVLEEGDVLLLCSDGLSSLVGDSELLGIAGQMPPELAARKLVDLANERGGSDNISVIIARAERREIVSAAVPPMAGSTKRRRLPLAWLGGLVLVLVIAAVVAALLLRRGPATTQSATLVAPGSGSPAAGIPTAAAVPSGNATQASPLPSGTPLPGAALSTPDAAALSTATAAGSPAPATSTLAPTFTPLPTPAPTRRPATAAPGATALAPTLVPSPSSPAPGSLLAEPSLMLPANGDGVEGSDRVIFTWTWPGTLKANQGFEVRLWKNNAVDHLGAAAPVTDNQSSIVVGDTPAVRQGGDGEYLWTVAVVQLEPFKQLSAEATPHRLVYKRDRGAVEPPATAPPLPTAAPLPTTAPLPTGAPPP